MAVVHDTAETDNGSVQGLGGAVSRLSCCAGHGNVWSPAFRSKPHDISLRQLGAIRASGTWRSAILRLYCGVAEWAGEATRGVSYVSQPVLQVDVSVEHYGA